MTPADQHHPPNHSIRVGTAGWSYADWNGTFYPKPMPRGIDRLTYVARYFDVVEVNSTYYHPTTAQTALGWLDKTADAPNFRFTMKLWKRFTHERDSAWTRAEVAEVRNGFDPVNDAGKLGAVLVQFPWSFKRTDDNRSWLGDVLAAFAMYPLVVEIRHESWNVPAFYTALAERNVGFVNIDQPLFSKSIKPSAKVTSPVGYVRVHGRNYNDWFRKEANVVERYNYLYSLEQLQPWVARTEQIATQARETYVVTNNHNLGKAGVNALQLKSLLDHRKVNAPESLVAAYPDALGGFVEADVSNAPR